MTGNNAKHLTGDKTMAKLYSITNRKLTKSDFKKALRESTDIFRDTAMLANDFPMYVTKIMAASGEVACEKAGI